MYFGKFKKIKYDNRNVTDITNRVSFLDNIKNDKFLTFEYFIDDNESPEAIAFNFYGDASLYWIILLINDIYDPVYDWVLSMKELVMYITDKYGDLESVGGGYGGIHHWCYLDLDLPEVKHIENVEIFTGGSNYQIGDMLISNQGAIKEAELEVLSIDGGGGITTLSIIDSGVFTSDSEAQFMLFGGHGLGATVDGVYSVPVEAVAVSNRQYEEKINDEKRKIKVLYPENLTQIKQELEYLLK